MTGFFGKSGLGAGCFIVVALDVLVEEKNQIIIKNLLDSLKLSAKINKIFPNNFNFI